MTPDRYVFEIGLYHQSDSSFDAEYLKARDEHMARRRPASGQASREPDLRAEIRFHEAYPCPWRYNDLVGFVHVFIREDRLHADLYLADWVEDRKKFSRGRKQAFRSMGDSFLMFFPEDKDNADLVREIRARLTDYGSGLAHFRKGIQVDLEAFDNIAPFVDWRGLMASVATECG